MIKEIRLIKKLIILIGFFFILFIFPSLTKAQTIEPLTFGAIEETGTHFEITDSEYLNVSLQSTEEITVLLESIPKTISLHIEASTSTNSSALTIKGLESNKTYYKYTDSYRNEEIITTDAEGKHTFSQELTLSHHIWFQGTRGTVFLPDDCSDYGNWDKNTKTCTLTQDLAESIEITASNVTVDCNGHSVTGNETGYGIYLNGKSGVILKNCLVSNFSSGVLQYNNSIFNVFANNSFLDNIQGIVLWWDSDGNTINENTISGSGYGIILIASDGNAIADNTVSNNYHGVYLWASRNNTLTDNTVDSNTGYGIWLASSRTNILDKNDILNNEIGLFLASSNENAITNNIFINDGVFAAESFHNAVENNKVNNKPLIYLEEISDYTIKDVEAGQVVLINTDNITLENLNLSNTAISIELWRTNYTRIINNKLLGNRIGIYPSYSNNTTVSGNTISDNQQYGIILYSSNDSRIYHNNLMGNQIQAYVIYGVNNLFDNGYPDGGNYWSDYIGVDLYSGPNQDQPGSDKIGDTPYTFTGGQDRYPFMEESGWAVLVNQPPTFSNLNQYKSDELTIIDEGRITTESTVIFKAMVSDPDNDQVKLQIELRQITEPFTGIDDGGILNSDLVNSGNEAIIAREGLVNDQYHWRARAIDDNGGASDWQEFGEAGNVDFEVKLVPLYTQVLSLYPSEEDTLKWYKERYSDGKSSCGLSIADCGCAITSLVMISRFHNITNSVDNKNINPLAINEWYQNNTGYWPDGGVKWEKMMDYSKDQFGIPRLMYHGLVDFKDTNTLDVYLSNLEPIILSVKALTHQGNYIDHFIVADGKLSATYTLKDPAWYKTTYLDQLNGSYIQDYNNNFRGLRLFSPIATVPDSISANLASPAEMLFTDPQGRKLGKDPITNITYSEIPNALYYQEGIGNPFPEIPISTKESKFIWMPDPMNGKYNIQVIGTETGSYTLSILVYDQNGDSKNISQEGSIIPNTIQEFDLNYSLESAQQTQLYRTIEIDIKPGSDPNSINCQNPKGVIPVAILTTEIFDAVTVDADTVRFGPNGAQEIHKDKNGKAKRHLEDVDKDGDLDLVFHFRFGDTGIQCGGTKAILTGKTKEGFNIIGSDSIRTVQGNNKQGLIEKLFETLSFLAASLYNALTGLLKSL